MGKRKEWKFEVAIAAPNQYPDLELNPTNNFCHTKTWRSSHFLDEKSSRNDRIFSLSGDIRLPMPRVSLNGRRTARSTFTGRNSASNLGMNIRMDALNIAHVCEGIGGSKSPK